MRFLPTVFVATLAFAGSLFATDLPTVKAALPPLSATQGGTLSAIDLQNFFEITDIHNQVVQLRTSQGTFNIEMLPGAAPASVANFLVYVNGGRYANTFIHRSDKGLGVIQGGGYLLSSFGHIVTDPPVVLEYNLPNTRGTLSMARTSALNSGTSEWFVNTDDNTTDLGQGNGGGYAVFGRVTGTGMTVVDVIAALPTYPFTSPFGQLPLAGYSGTGSPPPSTFVAMTAAESIPVFPTSVGQNSVVSFSVTGNTNASLVTAAVSASTLNLTLAAGQSGISDLTVTATDTNGNAVQNTFRLTVNALPVLTLPPSPFFVEATSAGGAVGTFSVTANDAEDGALTPNVSPQSGSNFPIGDTTVNVSATDSKGAQKTGSFVVRVRDTIGPVVTPPPNQTVVPASASGTVVNYPAATATDALGVTSLTYSKASGTSFPLGVTTVTVTAKDAANNTTNQTFTVTVAFVRPSATTLNIGARSGEPAPGAGTGALPAGTLLSTFGPPAVNDFRHMAARVSMVAGSTALAGIFTEDDSGARSLIAFAGGPVPGISAAGATFKKFLDPVIAPDGSVAFVGKVKGGGVTPIADSGVWTNTFGAGLQLALREDDDVPGLPAGSQLKAVSSISLKNGELLALLTLKVKPGVVKDGNDMVLLRMTSPTAATVLIREGRPLAGIAGSKVQQFSVLSPALGSPGHGRWHAEGLVVAKATLFDGRTLVVKIAPDGIATPLLSTAEAATAVAPDAKWKSFGLPAVSGSGAGFAVAANLKPFRGGVLPTDKSALLFSTDGTAWSVFAREHGAAPGTSGGLLYGSFFDPLVNDAGEVAFLATLQGGGITPANQTALVAGPGGGPHIVARLGNPVPDELGTATAVVLNKFISVALPGGPGAGAVFLGKTSGGDTTAANNLAVWAVDSQGKLRRLLRTGTALVQGGSPVTGFTLLNAPDGSFGVTRSFNATGSIALVAIFADGTQALLRADIP